MLVPWVLAFAAFAGSVACRSHRIVGGAPTTIDRYPGLVQVDIQHSWTGYWSQGCAGIILKSTHILSAAHCFEGGMYDPKYRRIRAGATFANYGGVIAYVQRALLHPEFNEGLGFEADLGIIRLSDRLIYSSVIQQTAIPPRDTYIPDNLPVIKAGWGATAYGEEWSDVLLDVHLTTINNNLCYEQYAALEDSAPVTKRMICAGVADGGKGACTGDAGGPLLYGDIAIGVISWGKECANASFPGVSIAVAPFTDWIIENSNY